MYLVPVKWCTCLAAGARVSSLVHVSRCTLYLEKHCAPCTRLSGPSARWTDKKKKQLYPNLSKHTLYVTFGHKNRYSRPSGLSARWTNHSVRTLYVPYLHLVTGKNLQSEVPG